MSEVSLHAPMIDFYFASTPLRFQCGNNAGRPPSDIQSIDQCNVPRGGFHLEDKVVFNQSSKSPNVRVFKYRRNNPNIFCISVIQ